MAIPFTSTFGRQFDFQLLLRNVKCVFQILLWNSLYPARQEETAKAGESIKTPRTTKS